MEQKEKNIHWFPGHMKKAANNIQDKLKLVDFVIALLDARAPFSTLNNYLLDKTIGKKKLFILNKKDLADGNETNKWISFLNKDGNVAIAVSLEDKKSKEVILKKIDEFCKEKQNKYKEKKVMNVSSRAMVIGIPNVGKSTFINLLANKKVMGTANTPGFTKAISWAKVSKYFELMDTPGILEPKFSNKTVAINLALIGSIKQDILPIEELANYCVDFLKENYLDEFNKRFDIKIEKEMENTAVFEKIAEKRGFLLKQNQYDLNKTYIVILKEFRNGLITRYTLEKAKNA